MHKLHYIANNKGTSAKAHINSQSLNWALRAKGFQVPPVSLALHRRRFRIPAVGSNRRNPKTQRRGFGIQARCGKRLL